jgi:hypothetical protein
MAYNTDIDEATKEGIEKGMIIIAKKMKEPVRK